MWGKYQRPWYVVVLAHHIQDGGGGELMDLGEEGIW